MRATARVAELESELDGATKLVEGVDVRLPTDAELDALEAFQPSLGRQQEVNIDPPDANKNRAVLIFTDDDVEDGKFLFDNAHFAQRQRPRLRCLPQQFSSALRSRHWAKRWGRPRSPPRRKVC
jgi:hypothetical protein